MAFIRLANRGAQKGNLPEKFFRNPAMGRVIAAVIQRGPTTTHHGRGVRTRTGKVASRAASTRSVSVVS